MNEMLVIDLADVRLTAWERHVLTGIAARLRDEAMARADAVEHTAAFQAIRPEQAAVGH